MRLSAATALAILLGLALTFGACGEDGTTAADRPASTVSTAAGAKQPTRVARPCRQLRGFIGSMAALRDQLTRGLSYDDYLGEVQSVRSLYRDIEARKLTLGCLLASGGPAERALNLYIDATNTWGDCLATVACSTRSIESQLQRKWALAAHRLAVAQRGLHVGTRG